MIQIALDWNSIIALEEDRSEAPLLRQIKIWYDQGKVALCISYPSRLENPQNREKSVIDEEEWKQKLSKVGLPDIELRSGRTRAFCGIDGSYIFDHHLELLVQQKIHAILFPNIDYAYRDYCRRQNVEPIPLPGFLNISEARLAASEEQRTIARKWNNAKCDALSLYAYSTWAEPDDLFVTTDNKFLRKREQLLQPFQLQRQVLAPPPEYVGTFQEPVALTEQTQNFVISDVIRGRLLSPLESVTYLQQCFGGKNNAED